MTARRNGGRLAVPAALVAVALALASGTCTRVVAQTADRDALAARAEARLRALRAEAEALLARERTLLGELRQLEIERSLKTEELRQLEEKAAHVEDELTLTTRHLDLLQRAHAEQTPALRARLREVYKLGTGGYVRLLLGVERPRDLGRALRTVSALAAIDRERARAHRSTLLSLATARAELETRRGELEALRRETAEARTALDRAVRSRAALVDSIDARRDLNAQLTGELQAAHARLQQTVDGFADGAVVVLPLGTLQGMLDWPVVGRVTAPFGRTQVARPGGIVLKRGIAIAAAAGSPVRAVHPGTVAHAAPFSGFGNLVILDHGGRAFSIYGYLDELHVTERTRVPAGGHVGSVGLDPAGKAGLYFELRVDGDAVDPLQWLKADTAP